MKRYNLIGMKIGYRTSKSSKLARVWPANELLSYFPNIPTNSNTKNPLIFLRDINKENIPFKPSPKTRRIEDILQDANRVNGAASILDRNGNKINTDLHAVFNTSFDRGGRIYSSGYNNFQMIDSLDRLDITINGNPIAELDYQAMFPRILYAMEGIQYPLNKDPYLTIYDDAELRNIFKMIILYALGSEDKTQAIRAGNKELRDDPRLQRLLESKGLSIKQLISDFQNHHRKIAHYFFDNKSKMIQNRDSQMALKILQHFSDKGIPCLPIHDSFIIEKRYADELEEIMQTTFATENNQFQCPITKEG